MPDPYLELRSLLEQGGVTVLSGAGLSTESGIPDYRGPQARPATPMTHQEFVGSAPARQRYWARSHRGWRFIAQAEPNDGHRAVARLQHAGLIDGIVTQNVDGLHSTAGADDVLELHGALRDVVCLGCGDVSARAELHERLTTVNPGLPAVPAGRRPDGDVDLEDVSSFRVVGCRRCEGVLKPDVVFFGGTVPLGRVERAFAMVDAARSLLVLGSSLTVMSGYRFVLRATRQGIPVAIVNLGPTRGDAQASVRVDAPLGEVLSALDAEVRRPRVRG